MFGKRIHHAYIPHTINTKLHVVLILKMIMNLPADTLGMAGRRDFFSTEHLMHISAAFDKGVIQTFVP